MFSNDSLTRTRRNEKKKKVFFSKGFTLSKNVVLRVLNGMFLGHASVCAGNVADPCVRLAYLLLYRRYLESLGNGSPSFL